MTLDLKGVGSNPATACSCQATCIPAEMPGINVLNVPVSFPQHAGATSDGKNSGWKVIRREIIEDSEEEVSWTSHARLLSGALIGRTGLLQQFAVAPCLQLKVPPCMIYTANLASPPSCPDSPLPMLALSSTAVCSSAGAVQ